MRSFLNWFPIIGIVFCLTDKREESTINNHFHTSSIWHGVVLGLSSLMFIYAMF